MNIIIILDAIFSITTNILAGMVFYNLWKYHKHNLSKNAKNISNYSLYLVFACLVRMIINGLQGENIIFDFIMCIIWSFNHQGFKNFS